jgi:hypothetical protein
MKKLVTGIVLLAIVAAVIYVQFSRNEERQSAAFRRGFRGGVDSLKNNQPDFDSVAALVSHERQALAEYKAAIADTLTRRDSLYARTVDSLSDKIEAQKADLGKLKQKALASKSPAAGVKKGATQPTDSSAGASHKEILDHYKEAMAKLPTDLSPYEYQVAVTEIRTETAAKFSITVDRLNEIRKANHIEF